jgi:hypothetical protein
MNGCPELGDAIFRANDRFWVVWTGDSNLLRDSITSAKAFRAGGACHRVLARNKNANLVGFAAPMPTSPVRLD